MYVILGKLHFTYSSYIPGTGMIYGMLCTGYITNEVKPSNAFSPQGIRQQPFVRCNAFVFHIFTRVFPENIVTKSC